MMQSARGEVATSERWILVTGGTGAIGSDIVRTLCANTNFRVAANFTHDCKRAEALQADTGCRLVRADVSDEEAVESMLCSLPGLWAVVHAAAISRNALLVQQKHDDWQRTLQVNAGGAFLVTRGALRYLADGGRLVLLASRVGEEGNAGQAAYAASKAAVIALMRSAAREAAEREICVNAVCPGLVPSALTVSLSSDRLDEFSARSVFGEFGSGRDVAGAIAWLLSPEAARISGQVLHSDSRI